MIDKKPWNYPVCKTPLVKGSPQIEESAMDNNSSKQNSENENTPRSRFKCKVCQRIFPEKQLLVTHSCTGRPTPKIYRCKTCPKEFLYMCKLVQHEKIHVMDKPYKCEVCYCSFAHACHLGRHMMTHSASANTKCIVCSKVFKNNALLEKHKLIHDSERVFKCDLCPKTFTDWSLLTAHFNEHTNDEKDNFEQGEKSGLLDNLATKSTNNTKNKGTKKTVPIHRKRSFRSCKAKNSTLKSTRGGKKRNFFKKTTRGKLENQKMEKSVKKIVKESKSLKKNVIVFQCDICKNEFNKKEELETHLQLHSMKGEKEYVCEICHKFFVSSNVYELHKKTYHQEKKILPNGANGQYMPRPSLFEKFNIPSNSEATVFTKVSTLSETAYSNSTPKQATAPGKSENGLPFANHGKEKAYTNSTPKLATVPMESENGLPFANHGKETAYSNSTPKQATGPAKSKKGLPFANHGKETAYSNSAQKQATIPVESENGLALPSPRKELAYSNSVPKPATVPVEFENRLLFANPGKDSCMTDFPARAKSLLENKFKCLICNENFANTFSLDFHLEKHIIVKTLPRNRHTVWSIHFPQKKFSCKVCRKSFSQRIILRDHSKIMHHSPNKMFIKQ